MAAFPGAPHHIPVEKPDSEIKEALFRNQNTVVSNPHKRKHYNRYSEFQVKILEVFFKECPHPDQLQRQNLGNALGMDPMKVKFWFQNKNTKLRRQLENKKKVEYQAENQRLVIENLNLKGALAVSACQICGSPLVNQDIMTSPEAKLMLQNYLLREEIERITREFLKLRGIPLASSTSIPSPVV